MNISADDVNKAFERIKNHIHLTPVQTSQTINDLSGKKVYFKCEIFQKTGSFKARGALNSLLAEIEKNGPNSLKGCVTHSSGNHGQALAWAAKNLKIECAVVVPEGTPAVKINAIRSYNGRIEICAPNPKARLDACERISTEENKIIIPPYDHYNVISGQGTIAIEFLEQVPHLDAILVPVSGGGMISGIALYAKSIKPSIKIFAVVPEGKQLDECLQAKKRLWTDNSKFLDSKAEAIRLQQCGQLTFPIMCDLVEDDVFIQSDESMIKAARFLFERMKIVVELAAGAACAAVLSDKMKLNYPELKHIGVILCGGNIDVDNLPWYEEKKN